MAACSDRNAEDAIGMDDVRVAFTLAVADVRTTRAANEGWDDYDHPLPGIEKENMINPDDLYIAICDKGGQHHRRCEDDKGCTYERPFRQ